MKVSDIILRRFFSYGRAGISNGDAHRTEIRNSFIQNTRYNKFWVLPYKDREIELPICLITNFTTELPQKDTNIVIPLYKIQYGEPYASGSTVLSHLFDNNFVQGGVAPLYCYKENNQCFHYGTFGAVFDEDFTPEFICSWQIHIGDNNRLNLVTPIIRFSPSLFQKKDSISTTLCNTVFKNVIGKKVRNSETCYYQNLKVIIEDWPYPLLTPKKPDINTTDEELKQILLDNVGEFKG